MTEPAGKNPSGAASEASKERPWYWDILITFVWTIAALAVFYALIGRLYVIPSGSMEPTLHGCEGCTGDRIFVEKVSYYFTDPEPGDIIVYEGTDSWNTHYVSIRSDNDFIRSLQNIGSYLGVVPPDENNLVKRIIATGGQTVSCQPGDSSIMVDGHPIDQSYTLQPPQYPINESTGSQACGGDYFGPITVPEDHYWMMGDNRTNSLDSRAHVGDQYQGTIPRENIRGKVQAIVLPFSRIGLVENPDIQPQLNS